MQDVNFYQDAPVDTTQPTARRIVPQGAHRHRPANAAPRSTPTKIAEPVAEVAADLESVLTSDDPRMVKLLDLMCRYFKIAPEVYQRDGHCQHAVMSAAALCLTYGFIPGRHVYVRRLAGEWVYETGYRAWLDSANQMAKEQRFRFDVQLYLMTDAEVRDHLGQQYSPGDCGYYARVLEDRIAAMYASMGIVYDPEFSVGVWRKLAFQERDASDRPTGEWLPDPIYHGRDQAYTAELRARKAALMKCYSLVELNDHSVERRLATIMLELGAELQEREQRARDKVDPRLTALPVNNRQPTADDPEMIFAI